MTLIKGRSNVASYQFPLGILAFLKLAEALRGRSEKGLYVVSRYNVGLYRRGRGKEPRSTSSRNELALNATGSQLSIASIAPLRRGGEEKTIGVVQESE